MTQLTPSGGNPSDPKPIDPGSSALGSPDFGAAARAGSEQLAPAPTVGSRHALTRSPSRFVTGVLLLLILLSGLALRVWNINFDSGLGTHPDERSTACSYAPSIKLPATWEQFWDPHASPLNPLWDLNTQQRRSFTYGHFPLYLGLLTGHALQAAAPLAEAVGASPSTVELMARAATGCDGIAVAGRLMMALLDTLTILLLYLLGRRMAGRGAGLLAAAFYTFAAQAIQLSHFFAMDPASTTFTVLAVLGASYMLVSRRMRYALLTGAAIGLAIASKFSALPLLALPVVAALLGVWAASLPGKGQSDPLPARSGGNSLEGKQKPRLDGRVAVGALFGVLLAWLTAGIVFFVTSPYAVLDWQNFVQATLVEQGAMVRGIADMPFTRQYRNTAPYIYFIQQQVQWGLGWPLGLVAVAGTLFAAVQAVRTLWQIAVSLFRRAASAATSAHLINLLAWAWVLPYFGLTGAFLAKFNRYMSPLLPFVLLWAAWLIVWLWNWRRQPAARTGRADWTGAGEATKSSDTPSLAHLTDLRPATSSPAHPLTRSLAVALATIGLLGGIFWSLAFVNGVYNREHTWVTASRWMYENIPSGSFILWELWDDPLPKSLAGEPGMEMYSRGLTNIDWSPYEEDTAEKYEILKQKLREADYVAYSSKRIYDSVDELPQRYPMTTLYYDAMWDGRLGFELAAEFTAPPQLFGFTFDDRHADESWSLYDHPQVTVFHKVRDLSDAEFDALFNRAWETAVPYYRGQDSPLSPLLNSIGLGSAPGSENAGLINRLIGLFSGQEQPQPVVDISQRKSLMLDTPLAELPVVDNYRWNTWASENTLLAVVVWWAVLTLLGWLVWPLVFVLFAPLRDRGYFVSRTFGWLLGGWLLWMLVNLGLLQNTVAHAWLSLALLAVPCLYIDWRRRREIGPYVRANWKLLLAGEALFAAAFGFFIVIRLYNPDLWQPWLGGEKQMEFAFLNGILRSPTFPPVDPHFAGGFINYYYFGLYLVAYLIKLTGIYAEVAFNLTIATLFALTVINVFAVAYSAAQAALPGRLASGMPPFREDPLPGRPSSWKTGFLAALLAPLFVTLIGNLDGLGQVVRNLADIAPTPFQSALPGLKTLVDAGAGLQQVIGGAASLPGYNFWDPSRVIPFTINEFPYWSFLFADLHPHLIGIPLAGLFLALALVLIEVGDTDWRARWRYSLGLLAAFALLLGSMAAVNLWELPTYLGLGVLAFLISQFRGRGRIHWGLTLLAAALYAGGAYLLFLPFFSNYVNVGASGVGLVQAPDAPEQWLLIWGLLGFVGLSWLLYIATRPARPARLARPDGAGSASDQSSLPHSRGSDGRESDPSSLAPDDEPNADATEAATGVDDDGEEPDADPVLDRRGDRGEATAHPFPVSDRSAWALDAEPDADANGIAGEAAEEPDAEGDGDALVWTEANPAVSLGAEQRIEATGAAIPAAVTAIHGSGAARAMVKPAGLERATSLFLRQFDRLPRAIYLHGRLVQQPGFFYLLLLVLIALSAALAAVAALLGWTVLALCLLPLGLAFALLWRRGREADAGSALANMLAVTGLALLAGTQLVYLKDFLSGGEYYRMNTLFKFFNQVWVLWGVLAAIAVPRIWNGWVSRTQAAGAPASNTRPAVSWSARLLRWTWVGVLALLLAASLVYPVLGTPVRLDTRLVGWRPPVGTLNGLDFMREGSYTWPDGSNVFELRYEYEALQWLLDRERSGVLGNRTILESSEVEYYRAWGTRIASNTGLSGLKGMHEQEQRYPEDVGLRDGLHREIWTNPDVARTQQIIDELAIDLVYVGQLERYLHPEGAARFEQMARDGQLSIVFQNERVTIYATPNFDRPRS